MLFLLSCRVAFERGDERTYGAVHRPAFSLLPLFRAPQTGPQIVRTSVTYCGHQNDTRPPRVRLRIPSLAAKRDTKGTEHGECGHKPYVRLGHARP